jgi:hypothetical protein
MDRSLHPPLLQNRACHFHGTRLLSDAPLCHRYPSGRQGRPSGLVTCCFAPSPFGASHPRASTRVLRIFSANPAGHLCITVLTSAYPGHYPRHWLLEESLPTRHAVGTYSRQDVRARVRLRRSQLPWLAALGRYSPPGLSAVQAGQYRGLPAP